MLARWVLYKSLALLFHHILKRGVDPNYLVSLKNHIESELLLLLPRCPTLTYSCPGFRTAWVGSLLRDLQNLSFHFVLGKTGCQKTTGFPRKRPQGRAALRSWVADSLSANQPASREPPLCPTWAWDSARPRQERWPRHRVTRARLPRPGTASGTSGNTSAVSEDPWIWSCWRWP